MVQVLLPLALAHSLHHLIHLPRFLHLVRSLHHLLPLARPLPRFLHLARSIHHPIHLPLALHLARSLHLPIPLARLLPRFPLTNFLQLRHHFQNDLISTNGSAANSICL